MHVVIMGCGRLGSTLAQNLDGRGHSVAVIDQNSDAFRRLGSEFGGITVTGVGFDRDTLAEAGIEEAGAFAAVSSGDNSNIISARVARETFGIDNVVARIYDPRRAEVYTRLGIPTVATVRWTADEVLRRLVPDGAHSVWADPTGQVVLAEVPYDQGWVGRSIAKLEELADVRVAYLARFGDATLITRSTVLQDGDVLNVIADRNGIHQVEQTLAQPPQEHE